MASLLIADDHPLFRAALRQAARDALGEVELFEAGTLDAVLALLDAQPQVDLVLLDLHMPGNHGLAGLAAIRAQFPAVAVVLVSANEDPQVVRRALDHGAAGYIPKSAGLDEMRDAIRTVLKLGAPTSIEASSSAFVPGTMDWDKPRNTETYRRHRWSPTGSPRAKASRRSPSGGTTAG